MTTEPHLSASDHLDDRLITLVVARPGQPGHPPSAHAAPIAVFMHRSLPRGAWASLWLIYERTLAAAAIRRRFN